MRYRDLESGVFITRDPAGFVDGPNVYTYVRQNPWTSFDPDGLEGVVISGQPGDHKNKTHFLSNGLSRAQKMAKEYSQSGSKETVKWMIYNSGGKGGYKKTDLAAYAGKAARAGVQVEIVNSARRISEYVNTKDGGRVGDKISKFSYIGHATPGTLDVGYASHGWADNINYDAIHPRSNFKSSAFAEKSDINVVGGCRTAVAGITSESVVDQFAHLAGKDSTIRGSTARIYYGGGVRTDDQLVGEAEEKGSIYVRRGMTEKEKETEIKFKIQENKAVFGLGGPY